jgi:hypothetical protein
VNGHRKSKRGCPTRVHDHPDAKHSFCVDSSKVGRMKLSAPVGGQRRVLAGIALRVTILLQQHPATGWVLNLADEDATSRWYVGRVSQMS